MQSLYWALIVMTAGFTASAIAANVYRIVGFVPESTFGHFVRVCVLMITGPSEVFETAVDGRMNGEWTALGFWLAITGICYWCLVIGLAVIHGANDFFVVT